MSRTKPTKVALPPERQGWAIVCQPMWSVDDASASVQAIGGDDFLAIDMGAFELMVPFDVWQAITEAAAAAIAQACVEKVWSPDDAAALRADAQAHPREIGASVALDELMTSEGLSQ